MPTEHAILLQEKYIQIYYIWVWNDYFFTCAFTLKILPMYCLKKLKPFYWLSLCTGFAGAGVSKSETNHFVIGQGFSIFACPTDKAIWRKNIMRAAENRFSGPGITVRLLDCFNSPHLATTQQSPNWQVVHVRTVKQFSCLRSSVRRSIYLSLYIIWLDFWSILINKIRNEIPRNILPTNPSMNEVITCM